MKVKKVGGGKNHVFPSFLSPRELFRQDQWLTLSTYSYMRQCKESPSGFCSKPGRMLEGGRTRSSELILLTGFRIWEDGILSVEAAVILGQQTGDVTHHQISITLAGLAPFGAFAFNRR